MVKLLLTFPHLLIQTGEGPHTGAGAASVNSPRPRLRAVSARLLSVAKKRIQVGVAGYRDVRRWLDLAAEVEWLFGDMLGSAGFYQVLLKNIDRPTDALASSRRLGRCRGGSGPQWGYPWCIVASET